MWWDTTRRNPGSYITVQNMVPNVLGNYETPLQPAVWGTGNTISGSLTNADAFQKSDGTARLFACNTTKIYEVTSTAATDRSKGGGSYTAGTIWHGAQYGDVTIYTNRADVVQASSSGAFADLAGTPPKARFICAQSLAVALAAYNDGANTYEDGIWISDIGDHTTWTPASGNEAANFRLLQTPGPITGIASFQGDFLAWKANSLYRISYVGLPAIWTARLVSNTAGAASMGTICVCDDVVVFGGTSGWFVYDGSTVTPIAPNRSPRMSVSLMAGNAGLCPLGPYTPEWALGSTYYDATRGMAHFYPQNTNSVPALVVQAKRGEGFGAFGLYQCYVSPSSSPVTIQCVVRGTEAAVLASGIGENLALGPYVGVFLSASGSATPYTLRTDSGSWPAASVWVQTSFFGTPAAKTTFTGVTPVACWYGNNSPIGALNVYTNEYSSLQGANLLTANKTAAASGSNYPLMAFLITARFACFQINGSSATEIDDILVDSTPAGVN